MVTKSHRKKHSRQRSGHLPSIPAYRGKFGAQQAERLLWRAGFGPRPGEAEALSKQGLNKAVDSLLNPSKEKLTGPAPTDDKGRPIAPYDAWGHDGLWWLDKMVRSNRQLTERMTLVWHDWFATSNAEVGSPELMIAQSNLFRRKGLAKFDDLLIEVTKNPAMLVFLSGVENNKYAPNENYGRELMELFTMGADRGYSENDVREQARALTGFRADWKEGQGQVNFRFDPKLHDTGNKKIFGKKGKFDWRDSCRLAVENRNHPGFFVNKLWSYFIPSPPSKRTAASLKRLYVGGDYKIRPVVEAILKHPQFYTGPRMVKPPIVYTAGLLRAIGRGVDDEGWTWISGLMGQRLFAPPNVAGWDDSRWLDTSTWRGRWIATITTIGDRAIDPEGEYDITETPEAAVNNAIAFWNNPTITPQTRGVLIGFAQKAAAGANKPWKQKPYAIIRQNALRTLIATSPDMQTC